MSGVPVVLQEQADGVLVLTLNRPEAMNAITRDVSIAVAAALERAQDDPAVKAVVITGAGERAFSAGADLKAVSRGEPVHDAGGPYEEWGLAGCTGRTIDKPVIAAVNGIAYGGGFEIALAADIIVAARTARFALSEVRVGLLAGAGGAVRLAEQLPPKVAMDLLLTGEPITAERAHALGLVSRLAEEGRALEEALRVARVVAHNAPLAVQGTKIIARRLENGRMADEELGWQLNEKHFGRVLTSRDAIEGATAFAEKRAPEWAGS